MPLNVAVVGCGKIADAHVEEVQKFADARVAAVCDLEPLMAEQLAVRYGVPRWFADVDEMLASVPLDVVHITTPPQSHTPLGMKAIDAGCHVFVEKPLSIDAATGRKLIDYAIAKGRKLSINYWPNFDPPALQLRELVEAGVIGEPVHIESYLGYNLAGGFGQALLKDSNHWVHRLPGKLFQNTLDHILNKISPFLKDEQPRLHAFGYRRRAAAGTGADAVADELRVVLQGEKVSAYATLCSHAKPAGHFLRLYGERNTVHVDYNLRTVILDGDQTLPSAVGRLVPPFAQSWRHMRAGMANASLFARSRFHYFAGMRELLLRFYSSIQHGTPLPISYVEMLRVAEWMDRIFAQVAQETAAVESVR
jgi:predicted dehydrogenase